MRKLVTCLVVAAFAASVNAQTLESGAINLQTAAPKALTWAPISATDPGFPANTGAAGDTYNAALLTQTAITAAFLDGCSVAGPPCGPYVFDGAPGADGINVCSAAGVGMSVIEADLGAVGLGTNLIVQSIVNDDGSILVDATCAGTGLVTWRQDVTGAAGPDPIDVATGTVTVLDSGVNIFDSTGGLVVTLGITDLTVGNAIAGQALIGIGGGDIAGFDLAEMQMFWDITTVPPAAGGCDHQIELVDSFGDGWDGAFMDVLVNGTPVLSGISAAGSGSIFVFTADTDDVITTVYTAGNFENEHSYAIFDGFGTNIGSDGPNPGPGITAAGNCPCDHTASLVDSFGDGWDGASMDVLVNGTPVLVGIAAAGSGSDFTFSAGTGDVITTVYTSGSFENEHSYSILDGLGNTLGGDGPNPGAGITVTGNCTSAVCGNGTAEPGEACDGADAGGCLSNTCNADCTCAPPAGEDCTDPIVINCGDTVNADTTGFVDDFNLGAGNACTGFSSSGCDTVYVLNLASNADVTAVSNSPNVDGSFYRITDCADPLADCVGEDTFPPGLDKTATWTATAGTDYFLVVDGFGGACGAYTLTVTCDFCGNGVVDAGEDCDGGTCCNADCTFAAGGECRASAGACDAAESCTGASSDCPADGFDTGTECRASAGACDTAESCDGTGVDCPADGFDTGTECRASTGACDPAESCDGSGVDCPTNVLSTDVCRPSAGNCDPSESCNGTDSDCPANVTIVDCLNDDGCCAPGCNANNDNNCDPICGNNVVEGAEECDDGNNDDGDGCDSVCLNEGPPVPTVSAWGLMVLALLLLAASKVYFGRRQATA